MRADSDSQRAEPHSVPPQAGHLPGGEKRAEPIHLS